MNSNLELIMSELSFKRPLDIVAIDVLTREQKIELLRQWEYDAREKEVAANEGMTGNMDTHLDEIHQALRMLDLPIDVEHNP